MVIKLIYPALFLYCSLRIELYNSALVSHRNILKSAFGSKSDR
jgi:hypothetical protein